MIHNQSSQKLVDDVIAVLKTYDIKKASLFGSYVRGENGKDSDLDILVELPKGNSLLDLVRLERKLEEALGKKVDVVTYKSVNPLLKEYIREQYRIL
ncbi:MAG: nucleotidyltransferase family protein [bacterium]|nr:nucleotidyltransferase family protein [bacterium]